MTKIIISIVSFLLILFPFSSTLSGAYQQLTFPGVQEKTNDINIRNKYINNEYGGFSNVTAIDFEKIIKELNQVIK